MSGKADKMEKSCGNCARMEKYTYNGKEEWACEESENAVGMPVEVTPPDDEPCKNWTDDKNEKGKVEDALRRFIDNYRWGDEDE